MSTHIQPGGAYAINLAEQVSEPEEQGVTDFPPASHQFNRTQNWAMAARMERVERGNISWFSTKKPEAK